MPARAERSNSIINVPTIIQPCHTSHPIQLHPTTFLMLKMHKLKKNLIVMSIITEKRKINKLRLFLLFRNLILLYRHFLPHDIRNYFADIIWTANKKKFKSCEPRKWQKIGDQNALWNPTDRLYLLQWKIVQKKLLIYSML